MRLAKFLLGSLVLVSTLAAAAPEAPPAHARALANTFSTDLTGLWYNPLENGWGVNIIQQSEVLFVTMFVYDANNKPTWYFGSDVAFTNIDSNGGVNFTGGLYTATGSAFSANYNSLQFGVTQVGTVNLRFASYNTGTITYTVNGVTVAKNVIPQTWTANFLGGNWVGAMSGATNCTLPLAQPAALLNFHITDAGSNATIQVTDPTGAQCTLTGTVKQYGKLVDIDGSYTCTGNHTGTFGIRRLEAGVDGLMGGFFSFASNCTASGATFGAAWVGP
jgi:hypothetical protein